MFNNNNHLFAFFQKLLNDVFELARYSYTNYKNAINIAGYLQNEIDYAPWAVAFKYFEQLLPRFKPSDLFVFEVSADTFKERIDHVILVNLIILFRNLDRNF